MREGFRMPSHLLLDTLEGKELISDEHVPSGLSGGIHASDEEFDERISLCGSTTYPPAESDAMGKI